MKLFGWDTFKSLVGKHRDTENKGRFSAPAKRKSLGNFTLEPLEDRRMLAVLNLGVNLLADIGGTPGNPLPADSVNVGDSFFVEITALDEGPTVAGLSGLSLDVSWDGAALDLLDNPFDPGTNNNLVTANFPLSRGGTLNVGQDQIDELRGLANPPAQGFVIGNGSPSRFSLLHFRADAPVSNSAFTVGVGSNGVVFADGDLLTGTTVDLQTISVLSQTPTITINDVSLAEGQSGTKEFTFTATIANMGSNLVTVDYATADGFATIADNDYVSKTGTLTFAPGQGNSTTQSITVIVNGDTTFEGDETFLVNLSNVSANATIGDAQGVGNILNDDTAAAATLSISDAQIIEGNAGAANMTFTVTLSNPPATPVTVNFALSPVTASPSDDDYNPVGNATLTFTPGTLTATQQTINIQIFGDTKVEATETFNIVLSNANGATISDDTGVGTITNDDATTISIADIAIAEGNSGTTTANVTVTLSAPSDTEVRVTLNTADGTATVANSDYVAVSTQVVFQPGDTTMVIPVTITGDTTVEGNETVLLSLTSPLINGINDPTRVTLGTANATLTINNDDSAGNIATLSIADVSIAEGNSGNTTANVTITLSEAATDDVQVTVTSSNGTATVADLDYAPVTTTVTIPAGQTSVVLPVTILADTRVEANETVTLTLSNAIIDGAADPSRLAIGDGTAVLTITNDDSAIVTINDLSQVEGNPDFNFTVTLSNPVDVPVIVQTNLAGNITVTIPAGSTSATLLVNVSGGEANEIVDGERVATVTLTGVQAQGRNVTLSTVPADIQGEAVVTDDDVATLSINDVTQEENVGDFVFTLTLTKAVAVDVFVNVSAPEGTDVITIPAGQLTKTFTVLFDDNNIVEFDGEFDVNLTGIDADGLPVTIADGAGLGTILDDDVADVTINDVSIVEGNNGTVNLVFTVTLSQAVDADVTLNFATSNGAATAGSDYTATTGTITFARPLNASDPFITTQTITIPIIGDTDVEPNETFMVTLSNLQAEGLENVGVFLTDAVGLGTITDDDATGPTLSISNGTAVVEGDSGTVNMVFTVTLTNPPDGPVQVSYQTVDGTATTLGLDYVNTFGVLTFTPGTAGATSQTITVPVLGDIELEADETFTVMLLNPNGGATIATPSGTGTITDDDEATISIADASAAEGTGAGTTTLNFTVTLSAAQSQDVTVVVNTSDGTATVANNDYTALTNQTVTIPAGQTSVNASVTITRDADVEANETFNVTLSNPQIGGVSATGLTLADANAVGTITNDDDAVAATVSIAAASVIEGTGAGTTTLQLTVTLSSAQTQDVTVVANTTNGTATAGTDYTAVVNQVITIPAGQTTATVSIPVTRDSDVEADETLTVTLTDPQLGGATDPNITLGAASATGTITNDDSNAAATLSIADVSIAEGTGAGTTTMTFTVTLSAVQNEDVTVTVNTSNGTATVADGDYTAVTNQIVTIPAGQTSATVTVTVAHDNKVELNETFLVTLSNPLVDGVPDLTTVGLGDAEATGTITNDDAATVSINDVSQLEAMGDQTFTVTLSNPVDVDVTVAVSDGTASQNVTIPAGQLTTTAVVQADDNDIVQFDFDYTVTLSNIQASGRNVTLGDAIGAGTILDDDFADVTISDVSIVEGNSGTTNLVFTVTLTHPVEADVTMTFTTSDLTATAGSDYVAKTVTVSFLVPANPNDPLITTQTVSVVINGDTTLEPNETFRVTLSDLDAEGLEAAGIDAVAFASGEATQTATGTITNDDGGILVSVADASLAENDANMVFTITLSEAATQPISVTVNTANGPLNGGATAGSDYTGVSGLVVTFAPGETSKTVSVPIAGDNIVELDETFTLTLSNLVANGQQVVLNDAEATGTITNNDTATVSIADATVTEGNSGTVNLGFVITLSGPVDAPVTMTFNTANGAGANGATAGSDYVAQTNVTVTFTPGGPLTQTVNVVVNGDTTVEPDELLTATLTALDAGGRSVTLADATATGTITNDDTPTISISDVTLAEGNSGTTAFTFTITLSAAMTSAVSVTVNTADGTATVGNNDYTGISNQVVTFAPGETSKTVTVNVTGDTVAEANETFNVNLSGLSDGGQGVTISDAQGVGTITNDDGTPAALVSIANVSVNEGNSGTTTMTFTVTLTHSVDSAVTVTVNSTDVTATAGTDYTGVVNQTVTIPAGQTSATFTVNVTGDLTVENDETFTLTLSNPLIGGVSDSTRVALDTDNSDNIDNVATGQITNDDIARLSIADITKVEGTGATPTAFTFTVTMSNPSDRAVTVTINTTDGTATAGTDYTALSGQTVTIAAGQTSATVTVNVTADSVAEANETFTATLSNPLFGGVVDTTRIALDTDNSDNIDNVATATITDDDGQSSLSGVVYMDANNNGVRDTGEVGLPGVQVTLRRTDTTGTADVVMLTGNDGTFSFTNVAAGTYSIIEAQPGAFIDGTDVVGSQGGTLGNDTLSNIVLTGGQTGINNNFGEVGLTPAFVTKRSFLGSTPDAATMLREMNARAAELAGNTALASSIRAGSSTVINATVSIGDATLSETNSGSATMTFNVTLSAASDAPVSVTVNTADGTATVADSDYTAITNQVVTFAAGETTKTVTVTLTGDTKVEANETFNVNLSNIDAGGRNITISDASAIGTINNDDAATVSIGNATTTEGATGTTNATFTVTLSAAVDANVAVTVNTANGTATTADTDYDAITNQTVTFTPGGALTQTITVPVRGDNKVETNETYTVTLSNIQPNGRNVTIGTATGTGTITNDDAATISVADAQLVEGNNGTTNMVFTVTLSSPVDSSVTVNATTTDGTATAGSDYTAVNNQTITFNAGTTTATVSVPITGDTTIEPNETFTLTLGSITAGGRSVTLGDAIATGTINNDDSNGAAQVSVSNVSVVEGTGAGTTTLNFTVNLSAAQSQDVTVTVNTANGTATAGTDYTALTNQTVTIPAGQTSATASVTVTRDSDVEADETLTLTLSNPLLGGVSTPASVVLGTATATGTITNDDPSAAAQVSVANVSVTEGTGTGTTSMTFTVTLSAAQSQAVTVTVNTSDGTATAGTDYTAQTNQTVTIPAGQTSATFTVPVTQDSAVEANETLTLTLSNPLLGGVSTPAALVLGTATATGTINDDDSTAPAQVAITNATISEGTGDGTTTLNFAVTLSAVQTQPVTVVINTADGTATVADNDYTGLTSQTVTIPAGQTTVNASVTVTRDSKVEADETLTATISDPKLNGQTVAGLVLGNATATGTITNDDNAPAATVSIANASIDEGTGSGATTLNFTVTLSAAQPQDVTVLVNTTDGSATIADNDYAALTAQTVTIPAGQTTATRSVTINRDNKVEADETFTITLTEPKLGGLTVGTLTLGTATATGTINNDDEAELTSQAVAQDEGNTGTSNATFTLTLSNPSDQPVTVVVNTTDGTATAGTDYTALTNQTITFTPGGSLTQTINVSINGDTTVEGNETFNLNFSGFNNNGRQDVTLPNTSVQGTINNDDQAAAAAVVASTSQRSLMVGVGGSGDVTEESLDENAVDSVFADGAGDEIAESNATDEALEDVLDWMTA